MSKNSGILINPLKDLLINRLEDSRHACLNRKLRTVQAIRGVEIEFDGRSLINFSSNNTLGLAEHPALKRKAMDFVQQFGTGATASRLISGNHSFHEEVEAELSTLIGCERALLFSSAFQANLTIIPAIADRRTSIFMDKECHNSLIQGALLSRAKIFRYNHQDLDHLKCLLEKDRLSKHKMIMTETLFGMSGDQTDLEVLTRHANHYNAFLYVDDAHAFGVMGKNGMGLAAGNEGIDMIVGGFGKAAGAFGGYAACKKILGDFIIQFCSGFIYTTALPPAALGAISAAINMIPLMERERADLQEKGKELRERLRPLGFETGTSLSHIVPIILGGEKKALDLSGWLERQGLFAYSIRPPTVPKYTSRLRLSLSTLHQAEHIVKLTKALAEWKKNG